jgi:hypothetical protein
LSKYSQSSAGQEDDEEDVIILEHRLDSLTVIDIPIQAHAAPGENQPAVTHYRIFCDKYRLCLCILVLFLLFSALMIKRLMFNGLTICI